MTFSLGADGRELRSNTILMIRKESIELVEASEIASPTLSDHTELAKRCEAIVPLNWPRGGLVEVVGHDTAAGRQPHQSWAYWYALAQDGSMPRIAPFVVGGGAVLLVPQSSNAQIAFRLLPQFKGHRYGESILDGLIDWIFASTHASTVSVSAPWSDAARVHILAKKGFALPDSYLKSSEVAEFVLRRG